jgi:hypothetical protein
VPVIESRRLQGTFDTIMVTTAGYLAVPIYTNIGLSVRLMPQ